MARFTKDETKGAQRTELIDAFRSLPGWTPPDPSVRAEYLLDKDSKSLFLAIPLGTATKKEIIGKDGRKTVTFIVSTIGGAGQFGRGAVVPLANGKVLKLKLSVKLDDAPAAGVSTADDEEVSF